MATVRVVSGAKGLTSVAQCALDHLCDWETSGYGTREARNVQQRARRHTATTGHPVEMQSQFMWTVRREDQA